MDPADELALVFARARAVEPSALAALGLDGDGPPCLPVPILTFDFLNMVFHKWLVCGHCGEIATGVHKGAIGDGVSIDLAVDSCASAFAEAALRNCPVLHGRAVFSE